VPETAPRNLHRSICKRSIDGWHACACTDQQAGRPLPVCARRWSDPGVTTTAAMTRRWPSGWSACPLPAVSCLAAAQLPTPVGYLHVTWTALHESQHDSHARCFLIYTDTAQTLHEDSLQLAFFQCKPTSDLPPPPVNLCLMSPGIWRSKGPGSSNFPN
jgi:hypothetical protein